MVIRMRADAQGRYGFNVKGGADQNYPVIVSRVAPGSSADKCNPRLNEGDQVYFLNFIKLKLFQFISKDNHAVLMFL